MIGRFSSLGSYRELLNINDFLKAGFGGLLALAGFLWDFGSDAPSRVGTILILIAVCINIKNIFGKN